MRTNESLSKQDGIFCRKCHHVKDHFWCLKILYRQRLALLLINFGNLIQQPSDTYWIDVKFQMPIGLLALKMVDPREDIVSSYLGHFIISWNSSKQKVVSRSSIGVEFRAIALIFYEVLWVQKMLEELKFIVPDIPIVYCDNVSASYLAKLLCIMHERNITRSIFIFSK